MSKRPSDMSLTTTVEGITLRNIVGNMTAFAWYNTIVLPNGRPDFYAIAILADFIYWHKATPVLHPRTHNLMGYERKFYADKFQANYKTIAAKFNMTVKVTREAIYRLIELGVLVRELRTITTSDGTKLTNVPFWDINLEVLDAITYPAQYPIGALVRPDAIDPAQSASYDADDEADDDHPLYPHNGIPYTPTTVHPPTRTGVEGIPPQGHTYTETTTENSTKISNPKGDFSFSDQTATATAQTGCRNVECGQATDEQALEQLVAELDGQVASRQPQDFTATTMLDGWMQIIGGAKPPAQKARQATQTPVQRNGRNNGMDTPITPTKAQVGARKAPGNKAMVSGGR